MSSYKDKREYIGVSDIASLTVRFPMAAYTLHFGEDGSYNAYIVRDSSAEIPSHYQLVMSGECWVKIYDDNSLSYSLDAGINDIINIYRAGEFGCIIQLIKKE